MAWSAEIRHCIDGEWLQIPPLRLGRVPSGLGTPNRYLTVMHGDRPALRVDLYVWEGCFQEILFIDDQMFVGMGDAVYVVGLADRSVVTLELDLYFGSFFRLDTGVLAASATKLHRLDTNGNVFWETEMLGVDGVIVHDVVDGIVYGAGEWDPPGGWKEFQVSLESGRAV
jgi:hypothetical protein